MEKMSMVNKNNNVSEQPSRVAIGNYVFSSTPYKSTRLHLGYTSGGQAVFCRYARANNAVEMARFTAYEGPALLALSEHSSEQPVPCPHLLTPVDHVVTPTGDHLVVFRAETPSTSFTTLAALLINNPHGLPEPLARAIFVQIVRALVRCQEIGISVRDITPHRILVFRVVPPGTAVPQSAAVLATRYHVVLADLSQAARAVLPPTEPITPEFMAPELVLGGPFDGFAADMWAMGVLFHVLLRGTAPWPEQATLPELRALITSTAPLREILRTAPVAASTRDAVLSLLQRDASARPVARELLDRLLAVPRPFSVLDPLPPVIAAAIASAHTDHPSPLLLGEPPVPAGHPRVGATCIVCQRVFQHVALARRHYDMEHGGVVTSVDELPPTATMSPALTAAMAAIPPNTAVGLPVSAAAAAAVAAASAAAAAVASRMAQNSRHPDPSPDKF
jgi:serine/threonine protein kinase